MKPISLAVVVLCAASLLSQSPRQQPGPTRSGGYLLVSGWQIKPAGRQIPLDTLPMSTALSRDGKHLLILNGGYNPPSISVFETASMKELERVRVEDAWLGLAFSPDGKFVYVGGGSQASVYEFAFDGGKLQLARTFPIVEPAKRAHTDFIGDVAVSPDGRLIYAAGLFHNAIHVINPQSGRVIEKFPTGRRPYRILFHPDGGSYFVSSWADASVYHHRAATGEKIEQLRIGAHPTDMVWRDAKPEELEDEDRRLWKARLFVAAANTNNVYSVGVSESKQLRVLESINMAFTPRQPLGMTPSALALSPDGNRIYTVCSDANAVAVVDVSQVRAFVEGFIPTGWYPTAARALPGGKLLILNGRGIRSFPNPAGPSPTRVPARTHLGIRSDQYVAATQKGSASLVEAHAEEELAEYSRIVVANSPYRDDLLDRVNTGPGNPVPSKPGDPSPIEHVLYIVKENRTYDQVLGDLGKGNGDPALTLFGENVTPNQHKLAREFVLFDNFYVNADVSADGHNWSTSAIANDYVQKMWPNSYGGRRKKYDYEGGEPAALPPAGYIWSNAAAAGVSLRNYGWWAAPVNPAPPAGEIQVASVRDPLLARYTSMYYRPYDLDYRDVDRANAFLKELAGFETSGKMPKLILMRLGNDHTHGASAGKLTPSAHVADNDYALGLIVEGLSRSRFWPRTAIFVLEDDAQNGPDHVDSHRSPAFVLSPYTRRGIVDSNMYNTTSMLRTIELIVGLRPMTHFDAGARPMSAAFSPKADTRPYEAEKPRVPLDSKNPSNTAAAARSARMEWEEADRIDDNELNDILWRVVKGTEPPVPVRSFFVR